MIRERKKCAEKVRNLGGKKVKNFSKFRSAKKVRKNRAKKRTFSRFSAINLCFFSKKTREICSFFPNNSLENRVFGKNAFSECKKVKKTGFAGVSAISGVETAFRGSKPSKSGQNGGRNGGRNRVSGVKNAFP